MNWRSADMRELWTTGWMHDRICVVVASFPIKDLLHPWQVGACWFWDALVHADLANNTLAWQWVASCAADAMPFFRIFNLVMQAEKLDPEIHYIRRWVKKTVPPILDYAVARERALTALKRNGA